MTKVGKIKVRRKHFTLRVGVTSSMMKTFLSCRQRLRYQLDGWESSAPKAALRFGSLIHGMLEAVYNQMRLGILAKDDLLKAGGKYLNDYAKRALEDVTSEQSSEEMTMEIWKAEAICKAYLEHYYTSDKKKAWLEVEQSFCIFPTDSFGVTHKLIGKRDGIFQTRDGGIWILETKTKSHLDSELDTFLAFDDQSLFYIYCLKKQVNKEMGKRIRGVLYNIIRTPQLRLKRGETSKKYIERLKEDILNRPSFYFIRSELFFPAKVQQQFEQELELKLKEMNDWDAGRLGTYKNETACITKYTCEFINMCSSGNTHGYLKTREMHREVDAPERKKQVKKNKGKKS